MRARLSAIGASLAVLLALASGCSKSPTSPTVNSTTDPGLVSSTLAASSSLVDDGLAEDPSQVSADEPSTPTGYRIQAAVRPFTWWQHITNETRTWSFTWSDTDSTGRPRTVVATLTKHMTGTFIIIPVDPSDTTRGDPTHTITKPLDKTLTRKVLLKRIPIGNDREWRVVQVSGAFVTTPGASTVIQSIRLQSTSGVDTTITDPLQFNSLRHVIKFGTSDSVTVTVTTNHTDDAVFIHRWDWRHRLKNNHDGTYTFRWVTSAWNGWRHFGIQSMTHGALYDDAAPFDSQAWHIPFRVVGGQPDVDYYP